MAILDKGLTFLVVENEAVVALDIMLALKEQGYRTLGFVATGEAAIRKAESERPDVVLMDIRLAGRMDGVEAAKVIGERCRIPVIFLTASSEDGSYQRAMSVSPLGFLKKPLDLDKLTSLVGPGPV